MFKEYCAVLRRHLKYFIGGASVSALGLIITFAAWKYRADDETIKILAWSSLAVLLLSIIPAQYCAWKEERIEREKVEAQLYRDADMRGKMTVEIGGYNPYEDQTKPGCFFKVFVDAANNGGKACTIGSVHVCVTLPEGQTDFAPYFEIPINIEAEKVESGDYFRLQSGVIKQPGVSRENLRKSRISIYLIDGLSRRHTFIETRVSPRILETVLS